MPDKVYTQNRYLVVLDVQEFPKKDKQLDSSVKVMIQNVNSLISHFNTQKVIYIKAAGKALNISKKGFSVNTLPAPDFDKSLILVSSTIFTKTEGDAFTSPGLISFLDSIKPDEILLVGLMADKCIYDTALGGKTRGYNIIIVPEAIVGTTPGKKEKAIQKMKDKGVQFVPVNEIITSLEQAF